MKNKKSQHQRDINAVKDAHAEELMAVPGVVGVYVGALDDGQPCIVVMIKVSRDSIQDKIPSELEEYSVVIEESGPIVPMRE
jgi:hypothetical protein